MNRSPKNTSLSSSIFPAKAACRIRLKRSVFMRFQSGSHTSSYCIQAVKSYLTRININKKLPRINRKMQHEATFIALRFVTGIISACRLDQYLQSERGSSGNFSISTRLKFEFRRDNSFSFKMHEIRDIKKKE